VLSYLARHRYRKSLYMIVGIKIGLNAEITHHREHTTRGWLKAFIPGALIGAPVDVGAQAKGSVIEQRYEKIKIPTSFVFAYRLREVRYFKKSNFIENLEYTKGADLHDLYGKSRVIEHFTDENVTYQGADEEIEIDGIFEEDFEENEHDTLIVDGSFMINSKSGL
jgi:hypothetical protein